MTQATREGSWSPQKSAELYAVEHWGRPYFRVSAEGNLAYAPHGADGPSIELKTLVDDLAARDVVAPILLRFNDILAARIEHLQRAFGQACRAVGYGGGYTSLLPIKVNQQRHVVEEMVRHGRRVGLGLEAGSKPELLVAIAMLAGQGGTIVCNGYKDREYVATALDAKRLGLRPFIVLDRFDELALVLEVSQATGVRPLIGLRAKLQARGSGRWKESSGDQSKFGLSAREMVAALEVLRTADMLDCLRLLHFHIGSQITAIRAVKEAIREAAHLYTGLREQGAHALDTVDCGGGLAIDYDGSRTDFHASRNYTTDEYAAAIVATLADICAKKLQPEPAILTESGRALVAQHSVLVFNVLGVHRFTDGKACLPPNAEGEHDIVKRLWHAYDEINQRNFQSTFNEIVELKEESAVLFGHGVIDLRTRAAIEQLFWAACERVKLEMGRASFVPDDLRGLVRELSDTYYCNVSIFQSLPDAWAVGHLFPIMPLHRLDEEPDRHATLADLTCDSDGKIDRFIDLRDVRETLRLHRPNGKPYYLGAFCVGAYQEILGDLHNLFGDTNAAHVSLHADGTYRLGHLVKGDTVSDVLGYIEYEPRELFARVADAAHSAQRTGQLAASEAVALLARYKDGLSGYTYLEDFD